ncbi:MAG: endolytic transglycosylase MltG [Peptococcaceae bacterium]|nr:endolytic transglycosylase MltG [Peptococcaceae bacterium]
MNKNKGRKKIRKKARRRSGFSTAASFFAVVILLAFVSACVVAVFMISPIDWAGTGTDVVIEVKEGMLARDVGQELEDQGLIRHRLVFDLLSRFYKGETHLDIGSYNLSPNMNAREIVDSLMEGPNVDTTVTVSIPEGYTVDKIIDKLVEAGFGSPVEFHQASEMVSTQEFAFLKGIPEKNSDEGNRLEGFLFPDTYILEQQMTASEILELFLKRFEQEVTDVVKERLAEKEDMDVYKWVIKASIIEREVVKEDERATVAGVFENRLKIGMKLQSCATVQFILKENKPVLSDKDTQIESLYNTYLYEGLPVGPIACPGKKSLEAALNPEENDYLYFVAKPDQYHAFAKTNEEHEQNKRKYMGNS